MQTRKVPLNLNIKIPDILILRKLIKDRDCIVAEKNKEVKFCYKLFNISTKNDDLWYYLYLTNISKSLLINLFW